MVGVDLVGCCLSAARLFALGFKNLVEELLFHLQKAVGQAGEALVETALREAA